MVVPASGVYRRSGRAEDPVDTDADGGVGGTGAGRSGDNSAISKGRVTKK